MVKVRLARMGTKKTPLYRVVVTDARAKRDGRHLENLGTWDPRADKEGKLTIDRMRLDYWLKQGAETSLVVSQILKKHPEAKATA